jgi:two-component system, OmpR family, KDP operon response regulator KdpE
MTLRVLLVEDDRELCRTLRDAMAAEGYEVFTAASLSESFALLKGLEAGVAKGCAPVDMVLLDLGLPDGDGEQLLVALRQKHNVPLIVVSARESDGQKVRLLDAGADDYLVKPFSIRELLARMRVGFRHRGTSVTPAVTQYTLGSLRIDLRTRDVVLDGQEVHLTPTEFNLLARLVRSAGQVVTHRQLLLDVWGAEFTEHTHYLRLYMAQLRGKLEENPADPQLLMTEPGVGYRIAEPRG